MTIMMLGGFGMRATGLVPDWFVRFSRLGWELPLTLTEISLL